MKPAAADEIRAEAGERDRADPLSHYRAEYLIGDPAEIYLDGNSLGRLPRVAVDAVMHTLEEEWGRNGVLAWDTWIELASHAAAMLAPLVGASADEVALADQTSVNLFKLAEAAGEAARPDIVSDAGNFPSDLYVLAEVAHRRGGELRVVEADPDEDLITEALDDRVGLVSLSHVAFRSGQLADLAGITEAVHRSGAVMLWDLSHSVGVVPIDLRRAGVDLAVGCTYKYLNGGPGAPAFLYVRRDLQPSISQPIHGWFGHRDQFGFEPTYDPAPDIRRFQVGTPPMLSLAAAVPGIELTVRAGIDAIRAKSMAMTMWFIELADTYLTTLGFRLDTPAEPDRRGGHVTLTHGEGWRISRALRDRRVIVDYRSPGSIRYGFAPLYTTFGEVAAAIIATARVIESGAYERYRTERSGVT